MYEFTDDYEVTSFNMANKPSESMIYMNRSNCPSCVSQGLGRTDRPMAGFLANHWAIFEIYGPLPIFNVLQTFNNTDSRCLVKNGLFI